MADVRALLKVKRQEARVSHPLASYTTGQLRCSVCGTNIKYASAWDGHLGSKAHRMNVARAKEEEKAREQQKAAQETQSSKRKADEDAPGGGGAAKKQKAEPASSATHTGMFPSDFFSDPSKAPPPPPSYDSDDDEDDSLPAAPAQVSERHVVVVGQSELDEEWIKFQHSVINAPDTHETYDRATVFAEPELMSDATEGFPPLQGEKSSEAEGRLDADEERRRKEQEEKELIMDRLMDEERAQEEADMKVSVLKSRLEALRTKRGTARTQSKIAV